MSSLQAILESINGSLKTTLESVSKLENLYGEGQEDKSNGFESFFDSKDKASSSSKERVSLLSLKNGAILSYVQSLLMIAHDKMDPDCRDPTGDKGRQLAIENRVVLERGVKPLEKKLSYQLDKLIRAYRRMEKEYMDAERRATEKLSRIDHDDRSHSDEENNSDDSKSSSSDSDSSDEEEEEMSYRPNVIKSKSIRKDKGRGHESGEEEENNENNKQPKKDGIYRPPKISAMLPPTAHISQHFEDKFNAKDHKDHSNRSRMQAIDEYLRDQSEQPDWESSVGANIVDHGRGGIKSLRDTERERRVTEYEEENFTRINYLGMNKAERKRMKQREHAARANIIGGEDFGIFNSKRKLEDSTSRRGNKRSKTAWERAKKRL
ncbi:small subunit rRNA maturation protein LCP5 PWA37_001215 [Arxiozyma heterogenica]|uniref:Uncharacterized protein n=1 Tax=Arxiozyma heterogenica TaxID=278026 RepID=A0AAN7WKK0_9SACH|nr:hypothetical protein RI543_003812 [Kazachstania heterogenica]